MKSSPQRQGTPLGPSMISENIERFLETENDGKFI